jgi:hypothetical protein
MSPYDADGISVATGFPRLCLSAAPNCEIQVAQLVTLRALKCGERICIRTLQTR